jgi:ApaG protein
MSKISENTNDIVVTVKPQYDGDTKDYGKIKFVFTYNITIQNTSPNAVKLISRKWIIFDSIGSKHMVQGDGVVGLQPEILPNEFFEYTSWCPLDSNAGYMVGSFKMKNLDTLEEFEINIPKFNLMADWVQN